MRNLLVILFVTVSMNVFAQNLLISDPKSLEEYYNLDFKKLIFKGRGASPNNSYRHDKIIEKVNDRHFIEYNRLGKINFDTIIYMYDSCGRLSLYINNNSNDFKSSKYSYNSLGCCCPMGASMSKSGYSILDTISYSKQYTYKNKLLREEKHFYLPEKLLFLKKSYSYKYRDTFLISKKERSVEYDERNRRFISFYKESYRYNDNNLQEVLIKNGGVLEKKQFKYNKEGNIGELSKGYLGYHPMKIFYSKIDGKNVPTSMTIGEGEKEKYYSITYK